MYNYRSHKTDKSQKRQPMQLVAGVRPSRGRRTSTLSSWPCGSPRSPWRSCWSPTRCIPVSGRRCPRKCQQRKSRTSIDGDLGPSRLRRRRVILVAQHSIRHLRGAAHPHVASGSSTGNRRGAQAVTVSVTTPGDDRGVADPEKQGTKRSPWIVLCIFPGLFGLFGVVFVLLLRVIPTPRPDVGTEYITAYFEAHRTSILVGMASCALSLAGTRSPTASSPTT